LGGGGRGGLNNDLREEMEFKRERRPALPCKEERKGGKKELLKCRMTLARPKVKKWGNIQGGGGGVVNLLR